MPPTCRCSWLWTTWLWPRNRSCHLRAVARRARRPALTLGRWVRSERAATRRQLNRDWVRAHARRIGSRRIRRRRGARPRPAATLSAPATPDLWPLVSGGDSAAQRSAAAPSLRCRVRIAGRSLRRIDVVQLPLSASGVRRLIDHEQDEPSGRSARSPDAHHGRTSDCGRGDRVRRPVAPSGDVSAGTTDGRTVDSVGESRSLRVAAVAPPAVRRGDDAVAALVRSHQAAEINRQAANRLLLCLVLTAPGAYCLGAARRQAGAPATD